MESCRENGTFVNMKGCNIDMSLAIIKSVFFRSGKVMGVEASEAGGHNIFFSSREEADNACRLMDGAVRACYYYRHENRS